MSALVLQSVIGRGNYCFGYEIKSSVEDNAASVIARAIRLNYLKTQDSKVRPDIFKRHALLPIKDLFGITKVKQDLAGNQFALTRDSLGNKLHMHLTARSNPVIASMFLDNLKNGHGIYLFENDDREVFESARAALVEYKLFLQKSRLSFLLAHVADEAIPYVRF